ncbi:hypothetical protein F4780DRAFT_290239 [Xylariomycetidae sp. FL0641]|nr:hypothetical protein F4780DRAFT_290239 [Xylariomycetidae sp. FL0641]
MAWMGGHLGVLNQSCSRLRIARHGDDRPHTSAFQAGIPPQPPTICERAPPCPSSGSCHNVSVVPDARAERFKDALRLSPVRKPGLADMWEWRVPATQGKNPCRSSVPYGRLQINYCLDCRRRGLRRRSSPPYVLPRTVRLWWHQSTPGYPIVSSCIGVRRAGRSASCSSAAGRCWECELRARCFVTAGVSLLVADRPLVLPANVATNHLVLEMLQELPSQVTQSCHGCLGLTLKGQQSSQVDCRKPQCTRSHYSRIQSHAGISSVRVGRGTISHRSSLTTASHVGRVTTALPPYSHAGRQ